MKCAKVSLAPLIPCDREQFILDNQWAFKYGAMVEFGVLDEHTDTDDEIISRETIEKSIDAAGSESYRIVMDGRNVGGVVLTIDNVTHHNHLDLFFVAPEEHGKGIGYGAWRAVEELHPETVVWETCTPYFEKRNIHFYVNKCGFQIDQFWCEYFQPTEPMPGDMLDDIPDDMLDDVPDDVLDDMLDDEGPEEMFHFIKIMK